MYEYPASDVVMFVAQCGLNEQKSKNYYQEKMNAQDEELNKILAEKDKLELKCEELEKKVSNLEWANKMSQTVNGKLNDTIKDLNEKNNAQA